MHHPRTPTAKNRCCSYDRCRARPHQEMRVSSRRPESIAPRRSAAVLTWRRLNFDAGTRFIALDRRRAHFSAVIASTGVRFASLCDRCCCRRQMERTRGSPAARGSPCARGLPRACGLLTRSSCGCGEGPRRRRVIVCPPGRAPRSLARRRLGASRGLATSRLAALANL